MKKILLLFLFLFFSACTTQAPSEDFCGTSTQDTCNTDSDCNIGGCSSQVCQSSSTEPTASTCEYRECYNPLPYSLSCGCLDQKCQWA